MLHSVQCDDLLVLDDLIHQAPSVLSPKSKYFGPFYYIQIDPQDYDESRTTTPEEEIHFQTPSKFGSPTTP